MSETINIAEVANKLSKEIFRHFYWETHPLRDDNFTCDNEEHTSDKGASKSQHPCDVVFYYDDPYLNTRIYLHTDLKSYANGSIGTTRVRDAFKSLCMTVECAKDSDHWRKKYSIEDGERYEVRGLLFIHNHDNQYGKKFSETIEKINFRKFSAAPNVLMHFLGPEDIQRLYSIGNDIIRLKDDEDLPSDYSFYYPDLVMWRRQGDVWGQAATIESISGSFFIIKHKETSKRKSGYVIYYNRDGDSVDEFVYFLDCLSRYQMLESGELIRVRITHLTPSRDWRSHFYTAKKNMLNHGDLILLGKEY